MLLWLTLSFGVALSLGACAALRAMRRADRRAKSALYRTLGYGDDALAVLMAQKGPASAQLALIRRASIATPPRHDQRRGRPEALQGAAQRAFRHTRALSRVSGGSEDPAQAARGRHPLPPHDPS
jgi:hypothetical protein